MTRYCLIIVEQRIAKGFLLMAITVKIKILLIPTFSFRSFPSPNQKGSGRVAQVAQVAQEALGEFGILLQIGQSCQQQAQPSRHRRKDRIPELLSCLSHQSLGGVLAHLPKLISSKKAVMISTRSLFPPQI